jgi:hypothetical protein
MKTAILIVLLVGAACPSLATIRTVAQDGNGQFTAIQPAVDSSAAGDTIVVTGAVNPYHCDLYVSRRLYIVGEGYGCDHTLSSKINGHVDFQTGSDGSVIEGFVITVWGNRLVEVYDGVAGIEIVRCHIWSTCDWALYVGQSASCTVRESTVGVGHPMCGAGACAQVYDGGSASFSNTVFSCEGSNYTGILGGNLFTTITLDNCSFLGLSIPLSGGSVWSVHNSVFWDCGWDGQLGGQVFAGYNAIVSSMTMFPQIPGQDIILADDPFVNYSEDDNYQLCVSDLHLPSGSPLIDAGDPAAGLDQDSTRRDMGVYGGSWPFSASGAPRFPFVTFLIVPASVPQNGVLEIRSTGRVGSGN